MSDIFEHINRAVTESSRPIIVEIGAARGEDTSRILQHIFSTRRDVEYEYYAFEPDPRNIKSLKIGHNNQHIHILPFAVGDANKRVKFHQSSGVNPSFGYEHTLSGSVKQPVQHLQAHPWCKFDTTVEVRMTTLDTFVEMFSIPHIDFIWCDVQGAEDLVLAGGAWALSRTRFFYTEYYNNEMYAGQIPAAEIIRRIGPAWKVVELYPNDILLENTCYSPRSVS